MTNYLTDKMLDVLESKREGRKVIIGLGTAIGLLPPEFDKLIRAARNRNRLVERVKELEDTMQQVIKISPFHADDICIRCFFCSFKTFNFMRTPNEKDHEDDCPWLLAKQKLEEEA